MSIPVDIIIEFSLVSDELRMRSCDVVKPRPTARKAAGTMEKKNDSIVLVFHELNEFFPGMSDETEVTVSEKFVSISRGDIFGMNMIFEEGKSYDSFHNAEIGGKDETIMVRVNTKKIENKLTMLGGMVKILCRMELIGVTAEDITLKMSIVPDKSVITS